MYILVVVALLAGAVFACHGAYGLALGAGQGDSGAGLVPWLQPPSWKPAYADDYNNLDALLKERLTPDNWVSLFCFSVPDNRNGSSEEAAFLRLALNTLYSYRVFGQASSDIVAALTPQALAECRKLRLPCYNASKYALDSRTYHRIGWAKVKLTRDLLKLGYNVHLSDLDISYLKPIHLARREVFSWSRGAADGSMMQEEWVHQDDPQNVGTRRPIYIGNTGVLFLRANSRTVAMMESLLKFEGQDYQDQYITTIVAYQSWAPCTEEASCLAARARGIAAVQLHPSQFAGSNCLPEPGYSPCGLRRLYVHAICRVTSEDKEAFLRYTRAMFIRAGGGGGGGGRGATASQPPAWDDPFVVGQQDNEAIAASGLPCPRKQQRAWSGWRGAIGSGAGATGAAAEEEEQEGEAVKRRTTQRQLANTEESQAEGDGGGIDGGGAARLRGAL